MEAKQAVQEAVDTGILETVGQCHSDGEWPREVVDNGVQDEDAEADEHCDNIDEHGLLVRHLVRDATKYHRTDNFTCAQPNHAEECVRC